MWRKIYFLNFSVFALTLQVCPDDPTAETPDPVTNKRSKTLNMQRALNVKKSQWLKPNKQVSHGESGTRLPTKF